MSEPITVLEALKGTKELLESVPVRIADTETTAKPILVAAHNLGVVIGTLEKEAAHDTGEDQAKDI